MQTALIIMTILGCDDSAMQCHYVETLDQRWETIEACDAEAEARLSNYNNISYPVVVAACQTPGDTDLAEAASETGPVLADASGQPVGDLGEQPVQPMEGESQALDSALLPPADIPQSSVGSNPDANPAAGTDVVETPRLARRILGTIREVLPTPENLKTLIEKPVHVVTDQYSWVAKRFDK
ncbi:hypothetical protein [Hoeflea sp.]|uniref:hypothetical protein n=1 Tax=Hoeflea sp. TaxID=1940281 RepID=UPI003747D5BD